MPGSALTTIAQLTCLHAGKVQITPGQTQVLVAGAPVVTTADVVAVAPSCALSAATPPNPCVTIDFAAAGSSRVLVLGRPVVLEPVGTGVGLCLSGTQVRQGTPLIMSVQLQVVGA